MHLRRQLRAQLLCHDAHQIALARTKRAFLRRYRHLRSNHRRTLHTINSLADRPGNVLHVAYTITCNRHFVIPLIAQFVTLCPRLQVSVRLDGHRLSLIRRNLSLTVHLNHLRSSQLITTHLTPHHVCLYTSPSCIRQCNHPRDLSRLDQRGYLVNDSSL